MINLAGPLLFAVFVAGALVGSFVAVAILVAVHGFDDDPFGDSRPWSRSDLDGLASPESDRDWL